MDARTNEIDAGDLRSPAILLVNPRFPHNVGGAVRAISCFGGGSVAYTGSRLELGDRLPREERMKAYSDTVWGRTNDPRIVSTAWERGLTPVAVELLPGTEGLHLFEHPEKALYVFGPEDGSLPDGIKHNCHRFVQIPSKHCLNLAAAVYIVLYDRALKRWRAGIEAMPTLGEDRGHWFFSTALEESARP